MGCGTSTIKFLLFLFNFIFALGGIALIVIGTIAHINIKNHGLALQSGITAPSVMLIIVGCIVFVIAFFGCCGAVRESHCMLITFASLMLLLFILTLTGGIMAFVFKNKFDDGIKSALIDLKNNYGKSTAEGQIATDAWDSIQPALHCCGVDSVLDWGVNIPASCQCSAGEEHCVALYYTRGCYKQVTEAFHSIEIVLGIFAIILALIQVVGIIFACTLASHVKQKKYGQ